MGLASCVGHDNGKIQHHVPKSDTMLQRCNGVHPGSVLEAFVRTLNSTGFGPVGTEREEGGRSSGRDVWRTDGIKGTDETRSDEVRRGDETRRVAARTLEFMNWKCCASARHPDCIRSAFFGPRSNTDIEVLPISSRRFISAEFSPLALCQTDKLVTGKRGKGDG